MRASHLARLVALAAPPRCAACGAVCAAARALCERCDRDLRHSPPSVGPGPAGIALLVAAAPYGGASRRLVLGLKLGRRLALAEIAAELLAGACPPEELRGTVVPVPAAPGRWHWRGFDPAEEIALRLASVASLPYGDCLRRRRGRRQVGRPRRERLGDPPRVRARPPVPARALLVDDVRTTGATLAACARALRAGGCAEVVALTVAHSR